MPERATTGAPAPKRVLVVEDDAPIREMIADELTARGFRVATVANGAEALDHLRAARPDVIVLDLMLPVMHGWDFVEQYRQITGGRVIPIVVVSAAKGVPMSFDPLGVRAYLDKPFNLEELADQVAALAGGE